LYSQGVKNFALGLFLALTAAGCASSSPPMASSAAATPARTAEPVPADPVRHENPPVISVRGASCDPQGGCGGGMTCITYYGVAGPKGPAFSTCETPCPGDAAAPCPEGTTCRTIADGPGAVCR
jgi:hypothetical protein